MDDFDDIRDLDSLLIVIVYLTKKTCENIFYYIKKNNKMRTIFRECLLLLSSQNHGTDSSQ